MSRDVDPAFIVGPSRFARMFDRSRWWAQRVLREWWDEQQKGGPVRVFRRPSGYYYTTIAIVDAHMPRRRDEALERRLRRLERDMSESFARIVDLERRIGNRR